MLKALIFLTIIVVFSFTHTIHAQENDSIPADSSYREQKKTRKPCKFFKFRKDTLQTESDSTQTDSIQNDSTENKKFKLFKKREKSKKQKAPEKPSRSEWRAMSIDEKEEYFKACHEFDSAQIADEIYSGQEKKVFEKAVKIYNALQAGEKPTDTLSRSEGDILKTIERKDNRSRYMLSENDFDRRKKMFRYEKREKDEIDSTMTKEERTAVFDYWRKKEALRKQKVIKKFDKKEAKLYKKYELSEDEKKALNRGKNMKLRGAELAAYERGRKKQIKLSEEIQALRRERAYEIQDDPTRKRIDQLHEKNKNRDKVVNKKRSDKQIRKQEKDTKKRIEKNKRKS